MFTVIMRLSTCKILLIYWLLPTAIISFSNIIRLARIQRGPLHIYLARSNLSKCCQPLYTKEVIVNVSRKNNGLLFKNLSVHCLVTWNTPTPEVNSDALHVHVTQWNIHVQVAFGYFSIGGKFVVIYDTHISLQPTMI